MKALLLEVDENGFKKKKRFLGPVITRKSLKKITQMFTTGKTCCAFMKWMESFKDIRHSDLLKHHHQGSPKYHRTLSERSHQSPSFT